MLFYKVLPLINPLVNRHLTLLITFTVIYITCMHAEKRKTYNFINKMYTDRNGSGVLVIRL